MDKVLALQILTSPIAIALALYAVLSLTAVVFVHPYRKEMYALANSLLGERKWTEHQREVIDNLLDRSMSFAAAMLLPVTIVAATMDILLGRDSAPTAEDADLFSDDRFDKMMARVVLSLAAANLIAALLALIAGIICLLVLVLNPFRRRSGSFKYDVVERPAIMAVNSFDRRHAGA